MTANRRAAHGYEPTIGSDHKKGRTPAHGYEPTREAAMAAFAKSRRRE